jgi:hypothetical protein
LGLGEVAEGEVMDEAEVDDGGGPAAIGAWLFQTDRRSERGLKAPEVAEVGMIAGESVAFGSEAVAP